MHLLLNFNLYFIFLLLIICLIYLILLNNFIIYKLFKLISNLKNSLELFNSFNFFPHCVTTHNQKDSLLNKKFYYKKRNYSTLKSSSGGLKNIDEIVEQSFDSDNESSLLNSIKKSEAIKEFKKTYSGGYLGYQNINNFGNVSLLNLINTNVNESKLVDKITENLENKLSEYLEGIPNNMVFSILPILRYKFPKEGYKSTTISKSIKVTRYTSRKLLIS